MDQNIRDALLEVIETSLEAQLQAVRELRTPNSASRKTEGGIRARRNKGRSHVSMTYDILASGQALHINDIIAAIRGRFDLEVDRESLASALSKRVARGDRFQRVAKNTFSLLNPPNT